MTRRIFRSIVLTAVLVLLLSSALLVNLPEGIDLSVAIRSLGNSLCSLESVHETWFLVDGKFVRNYGSVNVERPYTE